MAPLQISIFYLFILFFVASAQTSRKPKALLLPITKDPSTHQYVTQLSIGTPLMSKSFVLDLGGENLWMQCEVGYKSSTYRPGPCGSAPCSVANARHCFDCQSEQRPGCNNHTCILTPENTIAKITAYEELTTDVISLNSTDGSKVGSLVNIPNFIFSCAQEWFLDGLARGDKGMTGLGRTHIALPNHISSAFGGSFPRKFALCLPSNPKAKGVLFFGNGPYLFYPYDNKSSLADVTKTFPYMTTKLYINPVSTRSPYMRVPPSTEYFVRVKSLEVAQNPVPLNSTLLTINNEGIGGTKLSTINPYTILESSIYKAFTEQFNNELHGRYTKVAPVQPFTECYSTKGMFYLDPLLGWNVPDIMFVFEKDNVYWDYWQLYGANSMAQVRRGVLCLAFVDGGNEMRTSIVIGAHQMENYLFEFDLAASRLGITSTLHWHNSECSNFNL